MKVRVRLEQTLIFKGELELTQAEFDLLEKKIEHSARNSYYHDHMAHELLGKLGLERENPTDWGEMSVDVFEPVVPYRMAPP